MKHSWFIQLLLIAICIKFILNVLLVSIVFGLILGFKPDTSVPVKSVILGVVMGIESALITLYTSSFPGLSVILGIGRNIGLPLGDSLSYATIAFLALAYIVAVEMIVVALSTKFGELGEKFFERHNFHIIW